MNFESHMLPSNRKFGIFFIIIFWSACMYAIYINMIEWSYALGTIGIIFIGITIFKAEILHPLNKLWMRFGLILGMIVSPIILGIIFFGLFFPIAFFMRLGGRDELRVNFKKKTSHWISRNEIIKPESFKYQF